MLDIRICKYCGDSIDCAKAGYRTLNGHFTICIKNPKRLTFEKRQAATVKQIIDPRMDRIVKCIQCQSDFVVNMTERSLSMGDHNKHCSKKCANKTTYEKGNAKRVVSLQKAYVSGKLTGIKPHPESLELYRKENPRLGTTKRVQFNCLTCEKIVDVTEYRYKKRNAKFCSGKCRNIHNNKLINGNRSKAEVALEQKIRSTFPDLIVLPNDRLALEGMELDIYLPSLQIGIEWNGIWHYEDIRNDGSLAIRQQADIRKHELADIAGIKIITVKDLKSSKRFIKYGIDEVLKLINNIPLSHSMVECT